MPVIKDTRRPSFTEKSLSKKIAPAFPLKKMRGINTEIVVNMELSIGVIISSVPFIQASVIE